MKSVSSILIIFSFAANSFAEQVCISSGKEYAERKDKIPTLFQKLPLTIGGEAKGNFIDVIALVQIKIQSDAIVLIINSWPRLQAPSEVEKVCFNSVNNEMVISFKNGADVFKGKVAGNAVILDDVILMELSPGEEINLLNRIKRKSPIVSPDGGAINGPDTIR